MSIDLSLPTFALDCQDWLVTTEADGLLPDDIDGVPVLAVLSTALVEDGDLQSASAVFSLGLMDDADLDQVAEAVGELVPAVYVHETDWPHGHARFVVPAPDRSLAVIAEFCSAPNPADDLIHRFHDLVSSFRWTI